MPRGSYRGKRWWAERSVIHQIATQQRLMLLAILLKWQRKFSESILLYISQSLHFRQLGIALLLSKLRPEISLAYTDRMHSVVTLVINKNSSNKEWLWLQCFASSCSHSNHQTQIQGCHYFVHRTNSPNLRKTFPQIFHQKPKPQLSRKTENAESKTKQTYYLLPLSAAWWRMLKPRTLLSSRSTDGMFTSTSISSRLSLVTASCSPVSPYESYRITTDRADKLLSLDSFTSISLPKLSSPASVQSHLHLRSNCTFSACSTADDWQHMRCTKQYNLALQWRGSDTPKVRR